jgi:hypothetical protein
MRIEGQWTQVGQGNRVGWVRAESLPKLNSAPFKMGDDSPFLPEVTYQLVDRDHHLGAGGLDGLLKFAIGNRELRKKMNDPYFRDKIAAISSEWGPFYKVRTRHYYVKGICLKRMFRDHMRLSLAKRRMSYREMFGSLWSDDFMRTVIESNRGLLGNEKLFGKGREYFLELSVHF